MNSLDGNCGFGCLDRMDRQGRNDLREYRISNEEYRMMKFLVAYNVAVPVPKGQATAKQPTAELVRRAGG